MKNLFIYFTVFTLLVVSGCATIFTGTTQKINFSSEPTGAKVYIDGIEEGTTPLTASLKKGKEYSVDFKLKGYEDKSLRLTYSIGAGWVILDILAGLVGVVVDAVTEAWFSFDIENYKAVMIQRK